MIRLRTIYIFLCLAAGPCYLSAQQGIVASGGNGQGSGGSISYSMGQMDYISLQATGYRVVQGLQQPFEISGTTGISQLPAELNISVFPNPTAEGIHLRIGDFAAHSLRYRLISLDGKILEDQPLRLHDTQIPLANYAPGSYLLQVFNPQYSMQSFTILKY